MSRVQKLGLVAIIALFALGQDQVGTYAAVLIAFFTNPPDSEALLREAESMRRAHARG